MKRTSVLGLAVLALIIAAPGAWAQRSRQAVELRSTHVAGPVYMLVGQGGNIGVSSGDDGMLIVDDQFAHMVPNIRKAVAKIGDGELKFVLNTHFHGDHTGGNPILGKDALIIAHANVRERLSTPQQGQRGETPPMEESGLPVITFDESLSLHFNGEEIRLLHFPAGHTDTDSVIFFETSNVVHMGDHFFKDRFPFVDKNNGGTVEGYLKNVGAVIEQLSDDVKIIPGHGELGDLDDLKRFHKMIKNTSAIVAKNKAAGKTVEECVEAGVGAEYESWGEAFISAERWIQTLYGD